ncbi:MAG TPA: extracellular solute-binding protein [Xanthobacteraceae bacterium]
MVNISAVTSRIIRALAPAALGLVGAIAVSTPSEAQSSWNDVIAAAKKEGKVVIYNGTNYPIVRKLGNLFHSEYGIAVDVLDGRASEIRERIRSEQAAGRAIGDLIYSGSTSIALQTAEGAFQQHGPLPLAGNLAEEYTPNGTFLPSNAGNFAVLLNSNLVAEADAPKSWGDLTDPKWSGKILSDDPRALGGGQVWFEVTYRNFGRAFHEKIAAHKPVFSRVWAESNRRVARGEFPVYLPFNVSEYQSLKGLPIRPLIPAEGVPYVQFGAAILKDAPHPNAGRLFMNWLLDEPRQLIYVNEGFRPALKGIAAKIPSELRPLTLAKALGTTEPGKTQHYLDLAKEIYK